MVRRTTLGYFNPSNEGYKKAEKLANKYKKKGYKVVVEKNKRWGTLDVMKINKPKIKRKQSSGFINFKGYRF